MILYYKAQFGTSVSVLKTGVSSFQGVLNRGEGFHCSWYIYVPYLLLGFRVSLKAKNRWFVAYTLIKNPDLRRGQRNENDPCNDEPELNEKLIGHTNPLYKNEENYYATNLIN